jgi:hypothetical protein
LISALRRDADRETPGDRDPAARLAAARLPLPDVLSSFDRGRTIAHNFETLEQLLARRRGLHAAERDVLRLLKQKAA